MWIDRSQVDISTNSDQFFLNIIALGRMEQKCYTIEHKLFTVDAQRWCGNLYMRVCILYKLHTVSHILNDHLIRIHLQDPSACMQFENCLFVTP